MYMSKFEYSFEKVYEAFMTRATCGCFVAGDVVTFDMKKIQNHPDYKSLTSAMKSRLDDMMRSSDAGEAIIVVTDVILGNCSPKSYQPSNITIGYSQGGNRVIEPLTIPGSLTEYMEAVEQSGAGLVNKVPASNRIEYPVSTEAEEVDLKELEKNRTKGHASSTIHGESYENVIQFEVGKVYESDWGKRHKFECVKRTDTHVVLKPLTLDPDSLAGMTQNKPLKRKIYRTYNPTSKISGEYAKISAYAGHIYAEHAVDSSHFQGE